MDVQAANQSHRGAARSEPMNRAKRPPNLLLLLCSAGLKTHSDAGPDRDALPCLSQQPSGVCVAEIQKKKEAEG